MNKKTIIQTIVVVGAFAASAIVLYNGFFKSSAPSLDPLAAVPDAESEKILPYGDNFNYKLIDDMKNRQFVFGSFPYPKLDPSTEVGKDSLQDMMQEPVSLSQTE